MNASAILEKSTESYRDKILRKCGESVEMKEKFFSKYAEQIEVMAKDMAERFRSGKKLLVMHGAFQKDQSLRGELLSRLSAA